MQRIPLTQNTFALVDDDDFKNICKYKWFYAEGYAKRNRRIGDESLSKIIPMQRQIMSCYSSLLVDHIDGNRLNNTRSNLRICTDSENRRNVSINSCNKCGFKGVRNIGALRAKPWRAEIKIKGKSVHLGTFFDRRTAALKYDQAAEKLYGEFAKLNFSSRHQP